MGCDKRNKKLFTHIAMGSLFVVIIYIVVEAFLPKRNKLEGFGGSSSEDIIDYKVEASSWTFPPDELHVYIKAYHDKMLIEKTRRDNKKSKSNKNDDDDAGISGHFISLITNINTKLGTKKYQMDDGTDKTNLQILSKAIENDKSSKTGKLKEKNSGAKNPQNELISAASNDIMSKIDKLMKEWEKNKPKTE